MSKEIKKITIGEIELPLDRGIEGISSGDGENSILIGEGKAISDMTIAGGQDEDGSIAIAGVKGFFYYAYDTNTLTLSTAQGREEWNEEAQEQLNKWVNGTKLNVVGSHKHTMCSTVQSISGNVVTVDKLPFGDQIPFDYDNDNKYKAVDWSTLTNPDWDDGAVYAPELPEAGIILFGRGARSIGANTQAIGTYSVAEGKQTLAANDFAHAEGRWTKAGYASHAEGYSTSAIGQGAHSEGHGTNASAHSSHAEGNSSVASGNAAHAEGVSTNAQGDGSHAEGNATQAIGNDSHAEGFGSQATVSHSHAEGRNTHAIANSAHAEGQETHAEGEGAHSEGNATYATGNYSHAEGQGSKATEQSSHAEGVSTKAQGVGSHSEGNATKAVGNYSHAEGVNTINAEGAVGTGSHVEGANGAAKGNYSHVEGLTCKTAAGASGAHAEGECTEANAQYSHAEGWHTITNERCGHVQGKYNDLSQITGYAHIVGGGTSESDRKNIHTLDWNGNAVFAGTISDKDGEIRETLFEPYLKNAVAISSSESLSKNETIYSLHSDLQFTIDSSYTMDISGESSGLADLPYKYVLYELFPTADQIRPGLGGWTHTYRGTIAYPENKTTLNREGITKLIETKTSSFATQNQVDEKVNALKNELLDTESLDGTYNTLKEIDAWIKNDGIDTTELTQAIAQESVNRNTSINEAVDNIFPAVLGEEQVIVDYGVPNIDNPSITFAVNNANDKIYVYYDANETFIPYFYMLNFSEFGISDELTLTVTPSTPGCIILPNDFNISNDCYAWEPGAEFYTSGGPFAKITRRNATEQTTKETLNIENIQNLVSKSSNSIFPTIISNFQRIVDGETTLRSSEDRVYMNGEYLVTIYLDNGDMSTIYPSSSDLKEYEYMLTKDMLDDIAKEAWVEGTRIQTSAEYAVLAYPTEQLNKTTLNRDAIVEVAKNIVAADSMSREEIEKIQNDLSNRDVQADWNEEDTTSLSYIQNKPVGLSEFADDIGHATLDYVNNTFNTKEQAQLDLETAKSYTDTAIANLIDGAPETLNTLKEISDAMAEDQTVIDALEASIGTKADTTTLSNHTNNTNNPHNVTLAQLGLTASAAEINLTSGATSNIQSQINSISSRIVQPNWNETDTSSNAYIKNKPSLGTGTGTGSTVSGINTVASGSYSHAEGSGGQATGKDCHVEGLNCVASGLHAHAEGSHTQALADDSHAQGGGTITKGQRAHAEGYYTIAAGSDQHAQGRCNIESTSYAHIVGNGSLTKSTDDQGNEVLNANRSNAHTLDWNGNAWYAGDVSASSVTVANTQFSDVFRFKLTFSDGTTKEIKMLGVEI